VPTHEVYKIAFCGPRWNPLGEFREDARRRLLTLFEKLLDAKLATEEALIKSLGATPSP
jgi:hypothetical protein